MAFQCGFFNSVNGDRKYTAEQMNNPYKGIVSNGVLAKTEDSNAFQVLAVTGLDIVIKEGYGIFADKWAILDADLPMTIPTPNVSYTRIDSVIVRVDTSDDIRAGSIEYVQGTASEVPAPPALTRTNTVKEYRLANITVGPNTLEITQVEIEDTRPTAECGFVSNLLQNSDISALYLNWEAQFCKWFNNLKANLTAITAIQDFTSYYISSEENETVIPINIERYNTELDILHVYINGMILVPTIDYTINGYESITLTKPIDAGTKIMFIVYKTIDDIENETVASDLNQLYAKTNSLQEQVNYRQEFTYVVNSDQALLDWVNNVEGNDYTSVLIKKGTWTSSVGVNLTNAGTKVVVGEVGSELVFNITNGYGLGYDELPTSSEYYMQGINLKVNIDDIRSRVKCGIQNCINLTNCNIYVFTEGSSFTNSHGFYGCKNLLNCFTDLNTPNGSGMEKGNQSSGFYQCSNLKNCYTHNYHLYNMYGGDTECIGFNECSNLTECSGSVEAIGSHSGSINYGYVFYKCINLMGCSASCISKKRNDTSGTLLDYTTAWGFGECNVVSKCKASGKCAGGVFTSCYASNANNSTYAVADTPEGGFNNTTNPTA